MLGWVTGTADDAGAGGYEGLGTGDTGQPEPATTVTVTVLAATVSVTTVTSLARRVSVTVASQVRTWFWWWGTNQMVSWMSKMTVFLGLQISTGVAWTVTVSTVLVAGGLVQLPVREKTPV